MSPHPRSVMPKVGPAMKRAHFRLVMLHLFPASRELLSGFPALAMPVRRGRVPGGFVVPVTREASTAATRSTAARVADKAIWV